jgi:diguanylate cyclase (GGDEF)-like protein/PAS domain S-box-containing protein
VPAAGRSGGVVADVAGLPEADGWLALLEPLGDATVGVEAALAEAEHRFTALATVAPVAIFASEVGLRLGYVNDRFVAMTGVPAHGLLGTGWLDVVHRDDLPAVYSAVQSVLGGTAVELTVRIALGSDRQSWLRLRFAPTTTPTRAAGFIGTAEDVTEQRSWEEHLTYQARHDPLTGLVNRRRLIEVLGDLLSGRRSRDREFAVLFLDLDGFKEINDTYGHEAGDRALIEVARRMQRTIRDTDLAARVAGDEFVVVLRNITAEAEAEAAARRHLAALAAPVRIGRAEVTLSASVGIALPTGLDTPESLLHAADQGMYEAKSAGHGLYRLAPAAGGTR